MATIARPATALTASGIVALSAAFAAAPPSLPGAPALAPTMRVDMERVALAGFIEDLYNQIQPVVAAAVDSLDAAISAVPIVGPPVADQIDIIYTYAQQAVGGTVYWADDLVTPLVQGQFWPLSGNPGNYLAGAFNSTVNWASGLVNTAIGFIQAEIQYFGGVLPNIVQDVVNVIQNVINWITGWIPQPLAATPPAAAAAVSRTVTAGAAPTVKRSAARTAASASRDSRTVRPAASAGKSVRSAAAAKGAVHRGAKSAAARSGR